MFAHIARQAIFDKDKTVMGYELLYRDGNSGNRAVFLDPSAATQGVLSDAVTIFGLHNLTNTLPAYVNFTRELLLNQFALLVDAADMVIEVDDGVMVDDELVERLEELKKAGYEMAIDHYGGGGFIEEELSLFSQVKVDFQTVGREQCREIAGRLDGRRQRLIAMKIETEEEFVAAREMGYTLFQGYYFAKPKCMSRQVPSLAACSYGQLLNELQREELDYDACCRIVERDASLTYLLLRQVQTANYYRGHRIGDIRTGMVMLGTDELRRWLMLALVRQNNVTHSDELPRMAYLRALFIEGLMKHSEYAPDCHLGFLLGMFSLLDRIVGAQIHELLADLEIDPAFKRALMGTEENLYSLYLQYAIVYEMGNARLILPDLNLDLDEKGVSELYLKCFTDVDEAYRGVGRK